MKRRVRTLYPGFLVGTKGHSVLKKKTYAARKPSLDLEEIVVQRMPISRKTVEYSYPESVYSHSHASALSNAVVDDSYDLHHHSRGRDHHLLSKMNNALLSTELVRSPKSVVVSRRATRNAGKAHHLPVSKEVDHTYPVYYYHTSPLHRYARGYKNRFVLAPKRKPYVYYSNWDDHYYDDDVVDDYDVEDLYMPPSKLRYHYPTGIDRRPAMHHPLHYYYLRHHLPDWRHYAPRRVYGYSPRRHYYGRYYPLHYRGLKALLVGDDKLTEPGHHRRPRRRHYPDRPFQEHIAMIGVQDTSGLKASRPPAPPAVSTHSWKTIRDVEGYSKPHMSWEYRIDSHVAPELQIPKVSTPHVSMRDQVRGVHDKMDRHRQLLDRYSDRPAMDGLDAHTSAGAHTGGRSQLSDDMSGGDILGKVSPLRKKIRKVICKSRHDPTYYDD